MLAVFMGLMFTALEYRRLRAVASKPATRAFLEGVRLWGLIAVSEIAVWLALRNPEPQFWMVAAALAPLIGALVFNNLHIYLVGKFDPSARSERIG